MNKKQLLERVAVIPCHSGEKCWCRMLVYESYLKDKRRKGKILIDYGCAHKNNVERIANLINQAYDTIHKSKVK